MERATQPTVALSSHRADGGFLRRFIEGNYFYAISAIFVILGCKLLMGSSLLLGSEFTRTLKTLLILQGYELLLLGSAFIIVRRLRLVGDAFILFVIAYVLLLDPTFFSNSFHTMRLSTGDARPGLAVNFLCLVAAPLKLALFARLLRFRLTPWMWISFLLSAGLVYLAEYPLAENGPLANREYYYLLAWSPFLLAMTLPTRRTSHRGNLDSEFYSTRQQSRLPRLLPAIPLLVVLSHFLESAFVYGIEWRAFYFAPILLAAALIVIHHAVENATSLNNANLESTADDNASHDGSAAAREHQAGESPFVDALPHLDFFAIASAIISLPQFNVATLPEKAFGATAAQASWILGARIPLLAVGIAAIGLYAYCWLRLRDNRVFIRFALLGGLGVGYTLVLTGAPGMAWSFVLFLVKGVFTAIWAHYFPITFVIGAGALYLAFRYPGSITWFAAGGIGIFLFFDALPTPPSRLIPEILQAIILLGIVVWERFFPESREQDAAVWTLCVFGTLALLSHPTTARWAIAGSEALGAGLYAWRKQRLSFAIPCLLQLATIFIKGISLTVFLKIYPLLILLGGGASFAAGIYVTFHKDQLLAAANDAELNAISDEELCEQYDEEDYDEEQYEDASGELDDDYFNPLTDIERDDE